MTGAHRFEDRPGARVAIASRFMKRVEVQPDGCWRWTGGLLPSGYGSFSMGGRNIGAHRASFLLFRGDLPSTERPWECCVIHSCDRPWCVNPDHLSVSHQRENMADMQRKGRKASTAGELHGQARLTEHDVVEIRARRSQGESLELLSRRFGVGVVAIHNVCKRKSWRHVA